MARPLFGRSSIGSSQFATVAFGWGAAAVGGGLNGPDEDATVREFTNLNNTGAGSLRQALLDHIAGTGKSYIRPAEGLNGIITLTYPGGGAQGFLEITRGQVTISCREGDGIVIRSNGDDAPILMVPVNVSDVVMRHLNVFHGDGVAPSSAKDVILLGRCADVIIDHCCVGFGTDECLSSFGAVRVTVSNTVIHNGLAAADHFESGNYVNHSLGSLFRYATGSPVTPAEKYTLYNCAWIHTSGRLPKFQGCADIEMISCSNLQVDGAVQISDEDSISGPGGAINADIISFYSIRQGSTTTAPFGIRNESSVTLYSSDVWSWARPLGGAGVERDNYRQLGSSNLIPTEWLSGTRVAESPIQPAHIEPVNNGNTFLAWQRSKIGARTKVGTILPYVQTILLDMEAVHDGGSPVHQIYDGIESSPSTGSPSAFLPGGWTTLTP